MKVLRPFLWAIVLWPIPLYHSRRIGTWGAYCRPVRSVGACGASPPPRKTAGFSADEQNNIEIYKNARDAT